MESTNGANVTITLEMYTELVCKANDLEKVMAVLNNCKDDYIGSDGTRLIKALCGVWKGED
jgi:hypothetical protein